MSDRRVTLRRPDGTEVEVGPDDALITTGLTAADYYARRRYLEGGLA